MTRRVKGTPPQPEIVTGDDPELAEHRLLLITAAFPPDPRSGSLRWQKLSRYVAERGWGLDVVTAELASIAFPDPARVDELPSGIRIYGVRGGTPRLERWGRALWRTYRRVRPKRIASAVPSGPSAPSPRERPDSLGQREIRWTVGDPRQLVRAIYAWIDHSQWHAWAHDAAALAQRIIDPAVHAAVITSGPPHMAHEAGRLVTRATGLPLVLDMRDPWTLVERLPEEVASPVWRRLAERYERRAVRDAALVATNTEPCRRAMSVRYPESRDRLITVMNGCDDDPVPPSRHSRRFLIGYAGVIYLDRDPRLLFRAAAHVVRELQLTPADFGIEFIGRVERYGASSVTDIAREEGLEGYVAIGAMRPREAVMEFLAQSTMLVSLPQDSDLAIPAKIFEYVQFSAWLLALATPESAAGLLLDGSGADRVSPDDVNGIAAVLRDRVQQFRAGIRPPRLADHDSRFSRRTQAKHLLDAIEGVTRFAPARQAVPAQHA